MDMAAYKDEIRLKLTGDVLDLELSDSALEKIINAALREIQRYIDTTRLATLAYSPCIDLSDTNINSVVRVYRANVYTENDSKALSNEIDPLYASQWQILSGGSAGYNISNWVYNYAAWNSVKQIANTVSTDMLFRFDKHTNYLYVNVAYNKPRFITIEYVPRYNSVEEIVSDYWIDMLMRVAVALSKITVGRVRSRYTQSNALWSQDGDKLLEEGTQELQAIREYLQENTQLVYPVD